MFLTPCISTKYSQLANVLISVLMMYICFFPALKSQQNILKCSTTMILRNSIKCIKMTLNFLITHLPMENLNSLDQNHNTGGPPLTLFYMGGQKDPLGWLSYANPRGMPQVGWFFMTLFLSILERSWVGHFWNFFLKNPKNFTSTIFSTYNPKGGPFYASVRTPSPSIFFVLFWVKNGNNSTSNA